jgi:hypothetical protein
MVYVSGRGVPVRDVRTISQTFLYIPLHEL